MEAWVRKRAAALVLVALFLMWGFGYLAGTADAATFRANAYRASPDTLYVDLRIKGRERAVTVSYSGCVQHPSEFGPWYGCGVERERRVRLRNGRARIGLWVQRLEHRAAYDIASGPRHWRTSASTDAARLYLDGRLAEVAPPG